MTNAREIKRRRRTARVFFKRLRDDLECWLPDMRLKVCDRLLSRPTRYYRAIEGTKRRGVEGKQVRILVELIADLLENTLEIHIYLNDADTKEHLFEQLKEVWSDPREEVFSLTEACISAFFPYLQSPDDD